MCKFQAILKIKYQIENSDNLDIMSSFLNGNDVTTCLKA